MKKKVMIGCPVRNRAWILPAYLQRLEDLQYPREYIEYCFVINDCTDRTPEILADFTCENPGRVTLISDYRRERHTVNHRRGSYSLTRLAELRNILLMAFLNSECDYLFSVDSDILVPPDCLAQLIEDDCDIISALVCNGHELGDASIYNILNYSPAGSWLHRHDFPRDKVFQVDCTGAAYLIKKTVIEKYGVRYSAGYGAEDIGFCMEASSKGLKIYCDGRIECEHIMVEG